MLKLRLKPRQMVRFWFMETSSLKDQHGAITKKNNVTAFCRCGGSNNKPFCDGTHKKINFAGLKIPFSLVSLQNSAL